MRELVEIDLFAPFLVRKFYELASGLVSADDPIPEMTPTPPKEPEIMFLDTDTRSEEDDDPELFVISDDR